VPRISAIPIEKIRPHEEFDSKILNGIMNSLQSEGVVRDPVLIDSNTHMILDGTHRYWALIKLGCQSIPVALYSYMSDSVKIGCWYRCLELCDLEISCKAVASKIDTAANALKAVSERRAQVSIVCKDSARIFVSGKFDIFEAYSLLSTLEKGYKKRGYSVAYATECDSIDLLKSGRVGAVLAPPPIRKEEAAYAATTGKLFPIKSTRHILPSRPMGINVPLEWLKLSHEKADLRLQEKLSMGTFAKVQRGSLIKGRRYEEEVYIYELSNR
jgi:hypothetical protein